MQRLLNAARNVTIMPDLAVGQEKPHLDGLSNHQLFGLGPEFSRRNLDRARRRLVKQLHPDLWNDANPSARRGREDALKRVNAPYDALRPLAV